MTKLLEGERKKIHCVEKIFQPQDFFFPVGKCYFHEKLGHNVLNEDASLRPNEG